MQHTISEATKRMNASMAAQFTFRMDDELAEDLEKYRNQHEFRPDKAEIVRAALRDYLDERLDEIEE